MSGDEPVELTYDEAVTLLEPEGRIHTFLNPLGMLLGADWDRADVLDLLRTAKHRNATVGVAAEMGHGLVAVDADDRPVFIETRR